MQTRHSQNLFLHSPRLNQLNILREVAAHARVTQAELARLCSLSVAMVNNYMKDLCSSGLIEYRRRSSKSVSYHLTIGGERRLEALHLELIQEMGWMFAAAKECVHSRIMSRAKVPFRRVVLFGTGHMAQLVFHALELSGASILGVCDDDPSMIGRGFCGIEVLNTAQARLIEPDAVVVAGPLTETGIKNLSCLSGRGIEIIDLDSDPKQKLTGRRDPELPSIPAASQSKDKRETLSGTAEPPL